MVEPGVKTDAGHDQQRAGEVRQGRGLPQDQKAHAEGKNGIDEADDGIGL